nr:MAG: hypothetical protein DIU78_07240 [Pseudomonadota bacterium]
MLARTLHALDTERAPTARGAFCRARPPPELDRIPRTCTATPSIPSESTPTPRPQNGPVRSIRLDRRALHGRSKCRQPPIRDHLSDAFGMSEVLRCNGSARFAALDVQACSSSVAPAPCSGWFRTVARTAARQTAGVVVSPRLAPVLRRRE